MSAQAEFAYLLASQKNASAHAHAARIAIESMAEKHDDIVVVLAALMERVASESWADFSAVLESLDGAYAALKRVRAVTADEAAEQRRELMAEEDESSDWPLTAWANL